MFWGIVLGVATALLQSLSYLASAAFIKRHDSALKLLICSHVAMGFFSAVALIFVFPSGVFATPGRPWMLLLSWVVTFCLGQAGFFISQKFIESSRLASLLGLKIIVLSLIWVIFYKRQLNLWQIAGVGLSVVAAFAMNWSGGKRLDLKGIVVLIVSLICFSVTDFTETEMVLRASCGNMLRAGIAVTLLCYTVLGVCSLPLLFKTGWSWRMQRDSLPFSVLWLISQMTLLTCFGVIGPVFGNVIQSSRGLFSVLFGVLACRVGLQVMENNSTLSLWIRRALAALLMCGGIACFSFGKIIG